MKKFPYPLSELEQSIQYTFQDQQILVMALTHSSYSNEMRAHGEDVICNERLEFLGDSILSVIVSRYIYQQFSEQPEGDLTKIRASVVCEKALAVFAEKIQLGAYLRLGHGEELNGGRQRKSILADAFEALLAAIFIDAGKKGFVCVEQFLMSFIKEMLQDGGQYQRTTDYKTALQQLVQQAEGEILEYVLVGESGPDHMKTFTIEARLNSNVIGRGEGATKREAEQKAACEALILFGEK